MTLLYFCEKVEEYKGYTIEEHHDLYKEVTFAVCRDSKIVKDRIKTIESAKRVVNKRVRKCQ